jgi:hypothetical protein
MAAGSEYSLYGDVKMHPVPAYVDLQESPPVLKRAAVTRSLALRRVAVHCEKKF